MLLRILAVVVLCVVAATSGRARAADRAGTYTLTAPISYACVDTLFGMTAFESALSFLNVSASPPALTLSEPGEPGTMTGALNDPTFTAQKLLPGGCAITQSIAGTFETATRMNATYTISFTGSQCSSTNCMNQTFPFVAVRPEPVSVLPDGALWILGAALAGLAMLAGRVRSSA